MIFNKCISKLSTKSTSIRDGECAEMETKKYLGFKLQSQAEFVSTLLEIFSINQRRQIKGNTITELMLITKSNLRTVVDLSTNEGILFQSKLAANAKGGFVLGSSPSQIKQQSPSWDLLFGEQILQKLVHR